MRSLILYLKKETKMNWVFHFGLQEWVSKVVPPYMDVVSVENFLYSAVRKDGKPRVELRKVIYK